MIKNLQKYDLEILNNIVSNYNTYTVIHINCK